MNNNQIKDQIKFLARQMKTNKQNIEALQYQIASNNIKKTDDSKASKLFSKRIIVLIAAYLVLTYKLIDLANFALSYLNNGNMTFEQAMANGQSVYQLITIPYVFGYILFLPVLIVLFKKFYNRPDKVSKSDEESTIYLLEAAHQQGQDLLSQLNELVPGFPKDLLEDNIIDYLFLLVETGKVKNIEEAINHFDLYGFKNN